MGVREIIDIMASDAPSCRGLAYCSGAGGAGGAGGAEVVLKTVFTLSTAFLPKFLMESIGPFLNTSCLLDFIFCKPKYYGINFLARRIMLVNAGPILGAIFG